MRFAEKKARGFTLIEMAIVLVIIGIILAGVMKGRDIVRGAQVKQYSQQFAQKWGTIAQTYYDKTGQQLNDGNGNGGTGADADGWMDGLTTTGARPARIKGVLEAVGIDVCSIVKSKIPGVVVTATGAVNPVTGAMCKGGTGGTTDVMNPWQAQVDGEYAGATVTTIELVGLRLTISGRTLDRNVVVIYNVPTDVAQGIDTAVDGKNDGTAGSCIGLGAGYVRNNAGTLTNSVGGTALAATAWVSAISTTTNQALCQTVGIILDY